MKFLYAILITFLFIVSPVTFAQVEFSGYLGEEHDSFETHRGQTASYPKYWDWKKYKLNTKHEYTCRVWAKTFIPEIWIDDRDATGHSQSMPRSEGHSITDSGIYYTAVVTFRPLYNSDSSLVSVTSKNDSRHGNAPKGYYRVECKSKPFTPSNHPPITIRFPSPPPVPPVPTPPIDPCESPSWIINGTPHPEPALWMAEPPYGGGVGFAWEGDKIWILGGQSYLKQEAGGFVRYDRCGNVMSYHKRTYTKVLDNGHTREGGETTYPGKTSKGSWYVDWNN